MAVRAQIYPAAAIEIIVADGGSSDRTIEIARSFGALIVPNKLTSGEAGKAVGLRAAQHELVALIDSDNIMIGTDWLQKMVEPFADRAVVGAEPLRFEAKRTDGCIDRYCALAGVNDPLCLFMGVYDKESALTGHWTGLKILTADCGGYFTFALDQALPTIGANGTLYRREILLPVIGQYFMDIDVPVMLGGKLPGARFAKVRTGIRHLYCKNTAAFVRKQTRRVRDYFARTAGHPARVYPWNTVAKHGVVLFTLSCVTLLPLLLQSLRAFAKTRDPAAFYHPVACWLTLGVYALNVTFARGRQLSRVGWSQ
jgi:glycosyltransferase involved in cell wall biosynthesis